MGPLGRMSGDPIPLKVAGREEAWGTRRSPPLTLSTAIIINTLEGGNKVSWVTVIVKVREGADNS